MISFFLPALLASVIVFVVGLAFAIRERKTHRHRREF